MQIFKLLLLLAPFFGSEQAWEYFHIEDNKPKMELVNQVSSPNKNTLLNVPLIKQNPELRYGCEVTSLTMVLNYAGVKVNKMELYRNIQKDLDPLVRKMAILLNGETHPSGLLVI